MQGHPVRDKLCNAPIFIYSPTRNRDELDSKSNTDLWFRQGSSHVHFNIYTPARKRVEFHKKSDVQCNISSPARKRAELIWNLYAIYTYLGYLYLTIFHIIEVLIINMLNFIFYDLTHMIESQSVPKIMEETWTLYLSKPIILVRSMHLIK